MTDSSQETIRSRSLFDWICYGPPAIQIMAHVYAAFLIQSVFGELLSGWQEFTRYIWKYAATFWQIDIAPFLGVVDGLNLAIFVFLATFYFRRRNRGPLTKDILTNKIRNFEWPTFRAIFSICLPISFLVIAILTPTVFSWQSGAPLGGKIFMLSIYGCALYLCLVLCLVLLFWMKSNENGTASDLSKRFYSFIMLVLGLVVSALGYYSIVSMGYLSFVLATDPQRGLAIANNFPSELPWGLITTCLIAHLISFGPPRKSGLLDGASWPIYIMMFFIYTFVVLAPVVALTPNTEESVAGSAPIFAVFAVGLLSATSIIYLIRTNYRIAGYILVVAGLFIVPDMVLTYGRSFIN